MSMWPFGPLAMGYGRRNEIQSILWIIYWSHIQDGHRILYRGSIEGRMKVLI